jgi:hypothetical protein
MAVALVFGRVTKKKHGTNPYRVWKNATKKQQ